MPFSSDPGKCKCKIFVYLYRVEHVILSTPFTPTRANFCSLFITMVAKNSGKWAMIIILRFLASKTRYARIELSDFPTYERSSHKVTYCETNGTVACYTLGTIYTPDIEPNRRLSGKVAPYTQTHGFLPPVTAHSFYKFSTRKRKG